MPFVPVPKDLTKVKTKVAFNLTKRQLVCFGLGGLVGIPAYLFITARNWCAVPHRYSPETGCGCGWQRARL